MATIYPLARIINPERLTIGATSQIDDFVFINAGEATTIGEYVHIASFCSIVGGGELVMEDFSGLSAGCRIVTGSDDFTGRALTNPTVPQQFTSVKRAPVRIGRHAILGTNVIVLPGVTIGEGAAIGAGAVVRKSLNPWTIYAGFECVAIRPRPSERMLELEAELLRTRGES